MPKTPPLILPSSLPATWINRSKVNKRHKSNIYVTHQNKSTAAVFDETEECQFISNFNNETTSVIDHTNSNISSSIILNSAMDHSNYINNDLNISSNNNLNQNDTCQTNTADSSQQHSQKNTLSQTSFKSLRQSGQQCYRNTTIEQIEEEEQKDYIVDKMGCEDALIESNHQQLQSLLTASEDLTEEFKKFMMEHQEIKRSIDDKKKELNSYIKDRMQYLDQRQFYFQQQLKVLKDFM
ncbi:uncharacterized protein BX663DRAFT_498992 [Cokeromyces recurvatus]|uniref:uncharacterized protein n=1 Tax=Cokeromyces recurvatus TaxID=90255 RepID=UPI00221F8A58|nr:uncharacterized protein BX663DRAFT_498992 [Cokeromyces recurvatus]KAI7906152.1 hypothetical protein BX663DRAFT_498992 [Cokeromyces recurvatus]